ncbi:uncharacterized protein B0P05DRAFT_104049 [Gilbertella persicaria]|uniref:uncharacterized protein n=1 Tax=Gilbertella persicaria TaxID=101096 RepID=UPI002220DA97|nr:uncharacterized protein B0P05DRAFT_104049 [Gilbertella persicaria]KAI8078937.1 hypothetical protein B0P05DRAFT_104049 [Gilbertella persicaria]
MVCLGPRKKEKKSNLLSPDDANGTTATKRSVKKSPTSKLRSPSKAAVSLAPSIASTLNKKASTLSNKASTLGSKASARTSTDSKTGLPKPNTRTSLLSTGKRATSPSGRRPTSPLNNTKTSAASRPTSMASIKSNLTTASAAGTTNQENLKLIADQKAELERLKQQLQESAKEASKPASPTEEAEDKEVQRLELLKSKEEQLLQREKEIEELRIKLEERSLSPSPPAIVVQSEDVSKAEELAQKEKLLEERAAQLEEQKRLMEEQVPQLDQVASQLEALKTENLDAVSQLASKEKELEELRALIHNKPSEEQKEEDKQEALRKIEELNQQLEAQKKAHEESLRLHEEALAEKEALLKEQKEALDSLQENHQDEVRKLKTAQSSSIIALKKKHKQEKADLEQQVDEAKKEAEANPAVDIDAHLERILHEFEQAEHTHAVEIQNLEESHESELNNLENNQKAQLNKLKRTQDLTRDSWTSRYLPTEAVSWPTPSGGHIAKLKPTPTPLMESKSKTLLRVLDPKKVQIYYSSVSSNPVIKRNQEQIQQLLKNNNIKFSLVDVAQSETARQYAKKCNNNGRSQGRIKEFPQIYVGGEYRGQYEDVVRAIDDGLLEDLLHAAEERHFTPEERAAIQKAELNEELAGPMRSLPPIETMPQLRPTRSTNKPVRTLKDYDEDEELLKALEKELNEGNINIDDL